MRHILLALLLACAIVAGTMSGARADTFNTNVAFPPNGCSAIAPFMAFNGPVNGNNTYCDSGQDIRSPLTRRQRFSLDHNACRKQELAITVL
jgi:hypothetical protein